MGAKVYRMSRETSVLVGDFPIPQEAERVAILLATYDREDYWVDFGSRLVQSYRWIACPKCDARYRWAELAHREAYGHHGCDCGQRFVIDWTFPCKTAREYQE